MKTNADKMLVVAASVYEKWQAQRKRETGESNNEGEP